MKSYIKHILPVTVIYRHAKNHYLWERQRMAACSEKDNSQQWCEYPQAVCSNFVCGLRIHFSLVQMVTLVLEEQF